MTDFEVMVLFLIGLMLSWFALCWFMEYIIERRKRKRAVTKRLIRLEKENELLRKELHYQQYLNEVVSLCRPFVK